MGALNARYTITKKINFPIGQGEITVRKESEEDGFALYVLAS